MTRKFKPLIDKLYWIIFIPTVAFMLIMTVIASFSVTALFIIIPVDLTVVYLLISPLFGYAELREDSLFIKYGLLLKKDVLGNRLRFGLLLFSGCCRRLCHGLSRTCRERKQHNQGYQQRKCAFVHGYLQTNILMLMCIFCIRSRANDLCRNGAAHAHSKAGSCQQYH